MLLPADPPAATAAFGAAETLLGGATAWLLWRKLMEPVAGGPASQLAPADDDEHLGRVVAAERVDDGAAQHDPGG